MLQRDYQAATIDPTKLQIGIARVEVGTVDIGAIKDSSIEITTIVKERYEGYPAQRMKSETESVSAIATVTAEEIGSYPVVSILQNLFSNLQMQNSTTYSIAMFAGLAGVDNLRLAVTAQILPELSIDWQDDWSNVRFKFECIAANAQALLAKSLVNGNRQSATTVSTGNLSIGKPKVIYNNNSIGSIQSASLTLSGNTKKQTLGYPQCTAKVIYLDSNITISIVSEEGELPVSDDCKITLQQALVDGGYLEFEFPHCKVLDDLAVAPNNDWLGYKRKVLPFKSGTDNIVNFNRRN